MPILWKSFEDYSRYVGPGTVHKEDFQFRHMLSWYEHIQRLLRSVQTLYSSVDKLTEMGFADSEPNDETLKKLDIAKFVVLDIASAGEMVLFYHPRLAKSYSSYAFLHQKNIHEHWGRYSASTRIFVEIKELIFATKSLLDTYEEMAKIEDPKFLLRDVDLPDELRSDFILARDLFSIGFNDVGLLIVGRGLEGVLKAIARKKRIKIVSKGKQTLAHEASFYDLIEVLFRVKWQEDKSRLISMEIKNLLHFLRSVRNSSAHPAAQQDNYLESSREMAKVATQVANTLWEQITIKRARILRSTVNKDW